MNKGVGAASRYARREYGADFRTRSAQVAVGVAAVPLLPYDPNRISYVLTNNGTTTITLSRDPGVVSGQGPLLLGNGATLSSNAMEDGNAVAFGWYAISDLVGGSVNTEEVIESPSDADTGE